MLPRAILRALGGVIWGVGNVLLGYAAGAACQRAESLVGRTVALVAGGLVIVALAVWRTRRRRQRAGRQHS